MTSSNLPSNTTTLPSNYCIYTAQPHQGYKRRKMLHISGTNRRKTKPHPVSIYPPRYRLDPTVFQSPLHQFLVWACHSLQSHISPIPLTAKQRHVGWLCKMALRDITIKSFNRVAWLEDFATSSKLPSNPHTETAEDNRPCD